VAVRAQHAWDRLPASLCGVDARDALDDARLLHQCRIEFGRGCGYVSVEFSIECRIHILLVTTVL